MAWLALLPPGTAVIAAADFGPIERGQLGMVTERRRGTLLPWRRTTYVCTFLGGISVTATRRQIMAHDHGCCRQLLEDPLWFLHTRDAPASSSNFAAEVRRPAH